MDNNSFWSNLFDIQFPAPMKTVIPSALIVAAVAFVTASQAATVATSITPYRSLADSPWYQAVAGGDALAFYSHT